MLCKQRILRTALFNKFTIFIDYFYEISKSIWIHNFIYIFLCILNITNAVYCVVLNLCWPVLYVNTQGTLHRLGLY